MSPKVTDFGLAALADDAGQTATGQLVGTAAYMAPEQAEARTGWVGPAVDVYALGAILYECLTGRPPFLADTPLETIRQAVQTDPVPPRRLAPHVPRDLETVTLKCLAKEPARRYPTAAALADDLARLLDGRPVAARRASWAEHAVRAARRRPAAAAALFVAVAALATLVGAWASFTRDLGAETRRATGARADAEKARGESDRDRDTAVAERGRAEQLLDRTRDLLYAAGVSRAAAVADSHPHAAAGFLRDPEAVRPDRLEFAGRFLAARLQPPPPVPAHAAGVNAVGASRDGSLVVTAGVDGALHGWDGATVAERFQVPDAHVGPVTAVAVAADGSRVVTGGADGRVRVWNPADPARPRTLAELPGTVFAVAVTADGARVAASSSLLGSDRVRPGDDGTIRVWDAATGKLVAEVPRAGAVVRALAFAPDAKALAVGYAVPPIRGEVVLWDFAAARPRFTRTLGLYPAAVVVSPDGRTVAASSPLAGLISLWAADTGEPVGPVEPGPTSWALAFSPDGSTVTVGQSNGLVSSWAVATGARVSLLGEPKPFPRQVRPLIGQPTIFSHPRMLPSEVRGGIVGVVHVDRGRALAAVGSDGTVRLWTTDAARLRRDLVPQGYAIASFVPLGGDVLLGCSDGKVRRWHPRTGAVAVTAENLGGSVAALTVSADGARAAAVLPKPGGGGTVHVFDPTDGRPVWSAAAANIGTRLVFSPEGAAVAASTGRGVIAWDAATGKAGAGWSASGIFRTLAPGPAAGLVWVVIGDAVVAVDPLTGREDRRRPLPPAIDDAAFDPTGRLVAARRKVAQGATALTLHPPEPAAAVTVGGEQHAFLPTFSPDGRTLAAADLGRVWLWHTATGQELLSLEAGGAVNGLAFAPDGRGLAALVGRPARAVYWAAP